MWTDKTPEWMREIAPYNIHKMTLRKKRACLLVIDMQNEFLAETGGDFFHNALDIVPNVKRVMAACRKGGIPVIYTGHRHEDPAVDGGMTANGWAMQRLADLLGETVAVAPILETTALGTAYLAGQAVDFYGDDAALAETWTPSQVYEPVMSEDEREARYAGWLEAVSRVRSRQ